jgi:hypothetical protein
VLGQRARQRLTVQDCLVTAGYFLLLHLVGHRHPHEDQQPSAEGGQQDGAVQTEQEITHGLTVLFWFRNTLRLFCTEIPLLA